MKKANNLYGVVLGLLLLHAGLSFHAAWNLSPTWDEISYPAAGLSQLKTGQLNLNTVNPFLSKVFYAIPHLIQGTPLPLHHPSWEQNDEYRFGFQFTFRNTVPPKIIVFLGRIPIIIFSTLLGGMIFLFGRKIHSPLFGLISLLCYLTTPIFLSRATVSQLEMPMYFFMILALWFHAEWFRTQKVKHLFVSGSFVGISLLCKLVAFPLIPTIILMELLLNPTKPRWTKRFLHIAYFLVPIVVMIPVAYLPWKGGTEALRMMGLNLIQFDKILPYYWAGVVRENTPSLVSWLAFLVKSPIHVLILGAWGGRALWKSGKYRDHLFRFAILSFMGLATVLFFDQSVSTVQLSPVYLGLIMLAGGLVFTSCTKMFPKKIIIAGLLLFGVVDVVRIHPNYIGYFNLVAGGSNNGYKWLADSDQDWGQSLPALSKYLKKKGNPHILLSYSGSADPEAYGIRYQDLFSPALVSGQREEDFISKDTEKIFLVIGTKILQFYGREFVWLTSELRPIALVGQNYFVYDLSRNPKLMNQVAEFYRRTNRQKHRTRALMLLS